MSDYLERRERLLTYLGGHRITQALALGANLDIFDHLQEPLSLAELASRTRTEPMKLSRLLDVLVALEAISYSDSSYKCIELGNLLTEGSKGSLKNFAKLMVADWYWAPWAKMKAALRSRRSAFSLLHKKGAFAWMLRQQVAADTFHAAMNSTTQVLPDIIKTAAQRRDWSNLDIADLGGGTGALAIAFAEQTPGCKVSILDLAHAKRKAELAVKKTVAGNRITFQNFDFFKPDSSKKFDVVIMRSILHDWSDERSVKILNSAKNILSRKGQIIVIERVLKNAPNISDLLMDFEMMAMMEGGRERSVEDFERIFKKTKLRSANVYLKDLNRNIFVLTRAH